jgi:hypothetical protein
MAGLHKREKWFKTVERIYNLIIDNSRGVYMTDPIGVSPPFFYLITIF